MKKALALILAIVMVMALAVPTMAAEDHSVEHSHTITIMHSPKEYKYKAYQIFDGTLSDKGVLSNVVWGSGINGEAFLTELKAEVPEFAVCTDAASVATKLSEATAMDDPLAMAFADVAAKHIVDAAGVESTYNETSGHHEINGLEDGYYIVINTEIPEDQANTTVSRYILEVVRNITVTHKGTFPTVTKKILENGAEVDVNEAAIGETVEYKIVGTLPETLSTYETYYYAFRDTLSKGLTFNRDSVKVTVNGVDVTAYFYIATDSVEATEGAYVGGTTLYVGIQDLLALELLENIKVGEITADTTVVLTYNATLNENAIIVSTGNPNKVYLEYDNNPNTEGEPTLPPPNPPKPTPPDVPGFTPDDEVKTFVTELTILKKDGAGNALTGAQFTLTGETVKTIIVTEHTFVEAEEGETALYWELNSGMFTAVAPTEETYAAYKVNDPEAKATHVMVPVETIKTVSETVSVVGAVGLDGYVTFTGLGAGTYTLTETKTPDGFNTIAPITFTITFNPKTEKFDAANNNLIMLENDNTLYAEIVNVQGNVLPSTGGVGTTLFYIFGSIMFLGAAVLLVTKKRMAV